MSKSKIRQFHFSTKCDPDTGSNVTRLTPPEFACHRTYFYQKSFTNDGKKILYGGRFGNNWNYHLLDLNTQTSLQLTDKPDENTFGGFLSPDDKYLYFVRSDRDLIQLDLFDQSESVIYSVPSDWVGYGTWVSNSECTKIVGIEIKAEHWFPLTDWEKFSQMFHSKPRCRLISVDLKTGSRNVIHEENLWLGHPQYRPYDDNTVAFCHEGTHDLVDARMWFINEDGTNLRCGKIQDPDESCTHEFWVPDGSSMIYVSYIKGKQNRHICSLDSETLISKIITTMPPCSHLMSNYSGTLIVGDGSGTPVDVSDSESHKIINDPYLHLFDIERGTTRRIARHDTSWTVYMGNRQVTHPHPSFSPDERHILFTSDLVSEPALYYADL